jgi:hypothetical protein
MSTRLLEYASEAVVLQVYSRWLQQSRMNYSEMRVEETSEKLEAGHDTWKSVSLTNQNAIQLLMRRLDATSHGRPQPLRDFRRINLIECSNNDYSLAGKRTSVAQSLEI